MSFPLLQDFYIHLEGPASEYLQAMRMDWQQLHRKLVARRCRLVADVQNLYDIQPKTGLSRTNFGSATN